MTDMEMYENVGDILESQDKTKPSSNEYYETLQWTHQKKASTCAFNTPACRYCCLLLLVLACTSLSIATFVLYTTEKSIDGSWSSWANWEACSTSCDVGMQKRGRNCSNPAPHGNGRHCLGMDMEVKVCQSEPCRIDLTTTKDPSENVIVDGSWSSWTNWEACSTTCDVGMQKRGRKCSNPAPRGIGRQCLGTDMEVRLCQSEPCRMEQTTTKAIDGSWSSWTNWEACSTSCDVGMQKRGRNCSNPAPLGTGRQCLGMDMEVKLCQSEPCRMDQTTTKGPSENVIAIDGSWSSWASWEACSTSCDVGMQKRGRNCSNPSPRGTGRQCLGTDLEVRLCQSEPCRKDKTTTKGPSENVVDTYIAFNAFNADFGSNRTNVVFTSILLNEGDAYNKSNGIFTAPFTGLYVFIGHVCAQVSKDADYALKVEGKSLASGEFRTPSDADDCKCTSFSAVAAVQEEEKVWIECDFLYQNNNDWISFSGILIHKT